MDLKIVALLSLSFLLLLTDESEGATFVPMRLTVTNKLCKKSPRTYSTTVAVGGILVSAMRRLQQANQGFRFTVTEDPNFGLYLQSVNGVAGNVQDKTYWALLSESSGKYTYLNVGIGCYQPAANEHIVFNFTTW